MSLPPSTVLGKVPWSESFVVAFTVRLAANPFKRWFAVSMRITVGLLWHNNHSKKHKYNHAHKNENQDLMVNIPLDEGTCATCASFLPRR